MPYTDAINKRRRCAMSTEEAKRRAKKKFIATTTISEIKVVTAAPFKLNIGIRIKFSITFTTALVIDATKHFPSIL